MGLARVMQKKQYRTSDEHAWTFAYASPEVRADLFDPGVTLDCKRNLRSSKVRHFILASLSFSPSHGLWSFSGSRIYSGCLGGSLLGP